MELNFDFEEPQPRYKCCGGMNAHRADCTSRNNGEGVSQDAQPEPVEATEAEVVETTPFDQFDIARVKTDKSFLAIITKMAEMSKQASELKVVDADTNETAMQMLIQIKAMIKGAFTAKQNLQAYKIASEYKTETDKYVREQITKPLEKIDPIIREKVRAYQQSIAELERKKAAKLAEEEAEKATAKAKADAKAKRDAEEKQRKEDLELQAKLNLEADEAGVERVSVPITEISEEAPIVLDPEVTVTQKSEKVVADHGTAKIEATLIVKIIEPDKVPIEYCSPDQKKLDAAIECGVTKIVGCVIEESFDPEIRLSKKKTDLDFKF